jgi:hypothetical protein
LTIRNARQKLLEEFEAADAVLKQDMTELENVFLALCNEVNADSIKTVHGTVIRQLKERFICGDWENFRQFVLENQAVELLERRIHQGNFRQFLTEHAIDGLPPGVSVMREYGVSVRKATIQ